jgi:hypothetical protein
MVPCGITCPVSSIGDDAGMVGNGAAVVSWVIVGSVVAAHADGTEANPTHRDAAGSRGNPGLDGERHGKQREGARDHEQEFVSHNSSFVIFVL